MEELVCRLFLPCVLVGLLAIGQGCSRTKDAADAPNTRVGTGAVQAGAVIDNTNYRAELVLSGGCEHTKPCVLNAIIVAKGDYHINDNYPYRFTAHNPPLAGLTYPKPVVGREGGEFDARRAVLKVPFSAAAGERTVGGTLSLSVCSAANCLMDKPVLELPVRVD
jgi:hypothetical protein